ncbi:putative HVA22 protein g [Trifolium repens]|nr:putative HVA22 protein g [Trifolium repens]
MCLSSFDSLGLYYKVTKPLYFSPINPNLPPPHGAAPATATLNKPPPAIFSLHRGKPHPARVFLAMLIHGYAYPTYECYKGVENNNPEIEQLRFWCQSWNLVVLTVCERLGDTFISWFLMYSEAKLAFFQCTVVESVISLLFTSLLYDGKN